MSSFSTSENFLIDLSAVGLVVIINCNLLFFKLAVTSLIFISIWYNTEYSTIQYSGIDFHFHFNLVQNLLTLLTLDGWPQTLRYLHSLDVWIKKKKEGKTRRKRRKKGKELGLFNSYVIANKGWLWELVKSKWSSW